MSTSQLQRQQQNHENHRHWKLGIKQGVAFCNLYTLKKYEPETYNLFTQPFKDGDRVSTKHYGYRLKLDVRFRWSVTRFTRSINLSYNSPTPPSYQQQQSLATDNSAATAETGTKTIFQHVKERRESIKQQDVQELLDILESLQGTRRKMDSIVINTQNNSRTNFRTRKVQILNIISIFLKSIGEG